MGCDIHCFAEIKKGNEWVKVGKVFNNPYHSPERETYTDDEGYEWNSVMTDQPYSYRNYNLFAVLADVRNGRGFAGVITGAGYIPISDPRGLPSDVSREVWKMSQEYGSDGHSHSWFTLAELLEYDYNQLTTEYGWVTPEQYKTFKEQGKPENWCGGVSGSMVKHISNVAMEKIMKNPPKDGYSYYTKVEWGTTYRDSIGEFWFNTLEELKKLGNPDEVRLVFWFDN